MFIKLTDEINTQSVVQYHYVNPDKIIELVVRDDLQYTLVRIGKNDHFYCTETPDEIFNLINTQMVFGND